MKYVTGLESLERKLNLLKTTVAIRIERDAVMSGLNVVGKDIKTGLDSRVKHVRKTVKSRFKRGKVKVVAKVGFGVGPRNKKQAKARKPLRGGVGLSAKNVHWWLLGTGDRVTKAGANRGRMPAQQSGLVPRAYSASQASAFKKMVDVAKKRLSKEATKLRKQR